MAAGDIYALFPKEAVRAVESLDKLFGRGPQPNKSADDFENARDAALRALYREVIPKLPD